MDLRASQLPKLLIILSDSPLDRSKLPHYPANSKVKRIRDDLNSVGSGCYLCTAKLFSPCRRFSLETGGTSRSVTVIDAATPTQRHPILRPTVPAHLTKLRTPDVAFESKQGIGSSASTTLKLTGDRNGEERVVIFKQIAVIEDISAGVSLLGVLECSSSIAGRKQLLQCHRKCRPERADARTPISIVEPVAKQETAKELVFYELVDTLCELLAKEMARFTRETGIPARNVCVDGDAATQQLIAAKQAGTAAPADVNFGPGSTSCEL